MLPTELSALCRDSYRKRPLRCKLHDKNGLSTDMHWSCTLGIFGALAMAYAFEPAPTGKTATKSKPAVVSKKAKVPAKATSGTRRARTKGRVARRPARPSYQQHPDPERYAEIQKALADRGYFHGDANGEWK